MLHNRYTGKLSKYVKFYLCICLWVVLVQSSTEAQENKNGLQQRFDAIETNNAFSEADKLKQLLILSEEVKKSGLDQDTLQSKLYHRLGLYEYLANDDYEKAIAYTLQAANINKQINTERSLYFAAGNYFNLGYYYNQLQQTGRAIDYYDTAIAVSDKVQGRIATKLDASLGKANIFFKSGDYQSELEEGKLGIYAAQIAGDSVRLLDFLNHTTQAYFYQDQLQEARKDADKSIDLAQRLRQPYRLASAYKMKGFIYAKLNEFKIAEKDFKNAVTTRLLTGNLAQTAGDYNDFGNFFRDNLNNSNKAEENYRTAIRYAKQVHDSIRLCRISINRAYNYLEQGALLLASQCVKDAISYLDLKRSDALFSNPTIADMDFPGNEELLFSVFEIKTVLLLNEYRQKKDTVYLTACMRTAILTDSIITAMRNSQDAEQSKLYWRSRTRNFFTTMMDACYLANDMQLAFYFMEKSRAMLLNDKLNELGAISKLPTSEIKTGQEYISHILTEQKNLALFAQGSKAYDVQQVKLLNVKAAYEKYIKSLELKYPLYYQYKYASDLPSLQSLQEYLSKRNAVFVYYYVEDTVIYALKVSGKHCSMFKLLPGNFSMNKVAAFMQHCADKYQVNNNYKAFAEMAYELYNSLIMPLQLPEGRVILCPDNFLLPFEALTIDSTGRDFLLYHYTFSYVYSAQYLLKNIKTPEAKGNFIGFAPVSFSKGLAVPDLKNSGTTLEKISAIYSHSKIFTGTEANRRNFFSQMPEYSVVTVFSHAIADTGSIQPLLYMQDSIISLPELQLLHHPATQLVMLNACETNIGRVATGEGIYSLARGFSAAGIYAVSSTLWRADEETVYGISEKFNEYIAAGLGKDEALRKAKLEFIRNNDREKQLPYYWANMILTGDTDPVIFASASPQHTLRNIILPSLLLILLSISLIFYKKRKRLAAQN